VDEGGAKEECANQLVGAHSRSVASTHQILCDRSCGLQKELLCVVVDLYHTVDVTNLIARNM
jgi:hypothetical protein